MRARCGGGAVESCGKASIVIRVEHCSDHDIAPPALLCHKEPAPIIGPFRAWKPPSPYGIRELA